MIDQMINEARDSIIYGYPIGLAHLHAVADRVSVLACDLPPRDHRRGVGSDLDRRMRTRPLPPRRDL
jgi:hypothetical protein